MFTDIVGYTSLTQNDEARAIDLLNSHRTLIRPLFPRYHGKEVKTIGDAFLVEFDSALEALRCAYDIQQTLHESNAGRSIEMKVQLRIGIHLGDVIHQQNDVYGDAVNVASRIEPLATPGGICLTEQVYDQVRNKFEFPFVSLGRRELKNVGEAVEVYKVVLPWESQEKLGETLDKRRIAVLPFANMSSDPEEGYFADGMTEELITSLSGVRQLTVLARTSIMGYKGTTKKAKEIGKELEVGSMLEGSVRKAGNRVRITAQLIDTATEGHLWAQNYDRQLEDVFAIQSEIAEKVAGELKVRLVESERRVIERKATENAEAYTYYLRGRELVREKTEPSLRQAVGLLERAIAIDPTFAKAYAALAECYITQVNDGYESYDRLTPKAELTVKKSIQLDPELAEGHAILSFVDFMEDDVHGGKVEARRAIDLNPSLADAHWNLSNLALLNQDRDEGLREAEAFYHLDPVRPQYAERLGQYYFYLGMEEEALKHWDRTIQLAPAGTYRMMTEYYLSKGDVAKAKESFQKAAEYEPSSRWLVWMRGFIAAKSGDRETALAAIKDIEANWRGATSLNEIAFIYNALGDLDSYFTYANRATDQHQMRYVYVMYCPLFEKSRADPRYNVLMERLRTMIDSSMGSSPVHS
jgi:adenylate cyclase